MYEIEVGIEYPLVIRGKQSKYPFAGMKVGDSFAFPLDQLKAVRSATATYAGRKPGAKFSVLSKGLTEGRCWRVA